jgi:hypothetical protein
MIRAAALPACVVAALAIGWRLGHLLRPTPGEVAQLATLTLGGWLMTRPAWQRRA